jgi:hypothetical protein
MRDRATVLAWKIVSRLCAIPGFTDRLHGETIREIRATIEAELEMVLAPPPSDQEARCKK